MLAVLWARGACRHPACLSTLLATLLGLCWLIRDWDPHSRIISFLAPAFFIRNLMYLYGERLLDTDPVGPSVIPHQGSMPNI